MLKRLQVRNFRSLTDATFEPRAIELVIGPNGSGKTALCKVMQAVSLSASQLTDAEAMGIRDGVASVACTATIGHMTYEYKLSLAGDGNVWDRLWISGGKYGDGIVAINSACGRSWYFKEACCDKPYIAINTERDRSGLSAMPDGDTCASAMAFKRFVESWQYYRFDVSAMRSQHPAEASVLGSDGANLQALIREMAMTRPDDFRRYLNVVGRISSLFETLSDGTIRWMAIAYALMFATERPSLVIIEEPENGLHVSLYKEVMRLAEEASDRGIQVIFTSHSPYFIDLFDKRLDAITLCAPSENGSRIEKADPEWLKTVLRKFDLGEAYFRGLMRRPASKEGAN